MLERDQVEHHVEVPIPRAQVMCCSVETLDQTVDAEIAALPGDLRARLNRIGFLIEDMRLEKAARASWVPTA